MHQNSVVTYASPGQGAMAKGRASKKEPDAWETACNITNTVLEVAKVSLTPRPLHTDACKGFCNS